MPIGVVNLGGREIRVHTECARLVGDDRNEACAEILVPQQVLEQSGEGHRGRNFLFPAALFRQLVMFRVGKRDGCWGVTTLRQRSAEFAALVQEVLNRRVFRTRVVIRRAIGILLEFFVRNRDAQVIAERLQDVQRQLLHLVNGIPTLERLTQTISLDRLRENDGWLPLMRQGGRIGRVQLPVVVSTAAKRPNLVVGPLGDHGRCSRVAAKEVLANIGAGFRLERLEVPVRGCVHKVSKCTVGVVEDQ